MTPRDTDFTTGPVAPTAFVGRRDEMRSIIRHARQSRPPLQSLEGSSKIGRTSMIGYLHAVIRGEVSVQGVDIGSGRLIAPRIDLTLHGHKRHSAQEAILGAVTGELKARGFKAPTELAGSDAIVEVAVAMESLHSEGYRFLLLIDHVEHLLTNPSGEGIREEWSRMATAVLGDLNERISIAVLLAFGATGPAKDLRAPARRLKMLETLDALSQILNRGDQIATTLVPLCDDDVRALAAAATIPEVADRAARLTEEEIEWIVDLAGGHPLVMQNAGLKLIETRGNASPQTPLKELERQLADPGLQGFLIDVFRRVGPLDDADTACLEKLALGEHVPVPPDLRETLSEEGLIKIGEEGRAAMPSRALRDGLGAYLSARGASPQPSGGSGATHSHARISSPTLSVRGDDLERTLRLTRSEHVLMRALLDAGASAIVSRESLRDALGRNTVDSQLTQRLSILRGKITSSLGVPDAVESVYAQGYRLVEPDRFVLTDRSRT